MASINSTLGENICRQRTKLAMTQRQLADAVSELAEHPVSASTISAWERGTKMIPAEMIHYVCQALVCSSYQLFPHSAIVSDDDLSMMRLIHAMPQRRKQILRFMTEDWDGNDDTFWEFGLLYSSLPKYRRAYIAQVGIEVFKEALTAGDVDTRMTVDLKKIIKSTKLLEKEDDHGSKEKDH